MNTALRFASCLLLATLLAPAPVNLADDKESTQSDRAEDPAAPGVREFSDEELSAARATLAELKPEQRAAVNHLRFLMRPQYEEELMAGRAFAPCSLPPFEQPAAELQNSELLRLWAVLSSGIPVAGATKQRLQLLLESALPSVGDSLGELGLQMAVCALAAQRAELGLGEALTARAEELLDEATDARRTTDERSPLIADKRIDPKWFANHVWRGLICRFAVDLGLKFNGNTWERALRDLLGAGKETDGWRSKSSGYSEVEDLDSNLFAMAALSLAAGAPEGTLGKGILHSIGKGLEDAPGVLQRLDGDYAGAPRVGTRLAMLLSFTPELVPEGTDAEAWRSFVSQSAIEGLDPRGLVLDGKPLGQELGLTAGRRAQRICETALSCVALSGGLTGSEPALAGMSLVDVGRAMHACSVLHASGLSEGSRRVFRTYAGNAHELPEPGEIESFMLDGIDYLLESQHDNGGWGSAWRGRGQIGTPDPGTTAFTCMALMRAGHTPFAGEHKEALMQATEYILEAVEDAKEEGPRITEATGTQLQRKLGDIVDTAVTTQFLARVLMLSDADPDVQMRVANALDKCLVKIVDAQGEDGSWVTKGWAPVLQSAMYNQALELAALAGCDVDLDVLKRSRAYLARDVETGDDKTTSSKRAASAGVAFYAGSSALRATSGDAAEVAIVMEKAKLAQIVPSSAKVSAVNLRKIGYENEEAAAKATAFLQHETLIEKLEDENYLKGFGNNGGEEFISYMLSSESIVITGHETWDDWNEKLHSTFAKIQNKDGSWSGHHCITSPVLCTAAVLLTLTADREVHVMLETDPLSKNHATQATKKEEPRSPVTGK